MSSRDPSGVPPADATAIKPASAPPARSESRFTPGAMLADRFRIVALLGRGGMGEVYRADDVKLGQQVALKFLPISTASDPARLDRLYREVRIGRQVSHPNVCRLYDIMEWQGHHFISMEYIDGEDLASLLRRIGKLPEGKALDIARDVCSGLAAAHGLGIIHRDLKPANIMIDGRGSARVTDFGLAALAEELPATEIAGTPAYMAPEQRSGGEVTAKTDLYALGLVLYEIFTGKRVADSKSSQESARSQSTLSQETKSLDPAVQRVIIRCLEEKPESRPPSIHAVIAALPGGDPLQAAVDAGETPSPEMVAAAGETGELAPTRAWGLMAAVIVLLVVNAALAPKVMLYGRVRLPKKPDALAERARDLLAKAGYPEAPRDQAYTLGWNNEYFDSGRRSGDLDSVRPSPVVFYYRESPQELFARGAERRVNAVDPPSVLARMADVQLDPAGRLIRFSVVPPQLARTRSSAAVDWTPLLAETGIDLKSLQPSTRKWTAPVDIEQSAAWEGRYAEQPDVTVRIEAGARDGKPVWLAVIPPWQKADSGEFAGAVRNAIWLQAIVAMTSIFAVIAGFFLARRNLRRSRADRKNALTLGVLAFAVMFVTRFLRVTHVWSINDEFEILTQLAGEALVAAALAWLLYVSLEPYFRRRWPRLLIGWTRLLGGQTRDPLVGRDILTGAVAGLAVATLVRISLLFPGWLGRTPVPPVRTYFTALTEFRHVGFMIGNMLQQSVGMALMIAFMFLIYRIVFRSTAVATVILIGGFTVYMSVFGGSALSIPFQIAEAIIVVLIFRRFGLLALATAMTFLGIAVSAPFTLDTSAWYFSRGAFVMLLLGATAAYAFWISLAAQPLLGLTLLEED